jgi:nucleoside-triphosphatase THEP1
MDNPSPKILLTGPPGCGKTTLIRKVAQHLEGAAVGFYTEEVRGADGRRTGFDVVMLDGRHGPLASTNFCGPRVGRYRVDLHFLEKVALPVLKTRPGNLIVIDEIGKMECFSRLFCESVAEVLDSPFPVLATVAMGGPSFAGDVRRHPEAELVEVTVQNRDRLVGEILGKVELVIPMKS